MTPWSDFVEEAIVLAREARYGEAAARLEHETAFLLYELFERRRVAFDRLAIGQWVGLYQSYVHSAREMARLLLEGTDLSTLAQARPALMESLNAATNQIRALPGYTDFLLPPSAAVVERAAGPDSPLIYIAAGEAMGLAIVVDSHRGTYPVWLPELTLKVEMELIETAAAYGWGPGGPPLEAVERRRSALEQLCRRLWTVAMGPLLAAVSPVTSVTLIPFAGLGLLPFHAAMKTDAGGQPHYALDEMTISYAPNARVLPFLRETAARVPGRRLMALAVGQDLRWPGEEAQAVLRHFEDPTFLPDRAARKGALLGMLSDHDVLHFAAHGHVNFKRPRFSFIRLWGDEPLALTEIARMRTAGLRLAFLSACDGNVLGSVLPYLGLSLAAGFLAAGAAGVIAPYGNVEDEATMMLVRRFYKEWRENGVVPAEALRRSQVWLRRATNRQVWDECPELDLMRASGEPDERPYEHPLDWAAFVHVGV